MMFRKEMRTVSNTYNFLQEMTTEIINRLKDTDDEIYKNYAKYGKALLYKWMGASDRTESTEQLKLFNKQALDLLTGKATTMKSDTFIDNLVPIEELNSDVKSK